MNKFKEISKKIIFSYRALPDKKKYLEFITGALSIPVLVTAFVINMNNINNKSSPSAPTPTPQITKEHTYINISTPSNEKSTKNDNSAVSATPIPETTISAAPCKAGIGDVNISSPEEGDTIKDNPVSVIVTYAPGDYCSAVWSYKINNGSWSEYDDKSLALYNLPQGKITMNLKVKSIISSDTKTLTRSFNYEGETKSVTPTAIPTSSSSVKSSSASAN